LAGVEAVLDYLELAGGDAAVVGLAVDLAIAADFHPDVAGERVHDGGADSVQARRDLVGLAAELAAGVEQRHHRLEGGLAGRRVGVDGYAHAVVAHGDAAVFRDVDPDAVAAAGHGLVDAVVDDLRNQLVQAALVGAADIHAGPAPDGLEAFQYLDVTRGVLFGYGFSFCCHGLTMPA